MNVVRLACRAWLNRLKQVEMVRDGREQEPPELTQECLTMFTSLIVLCVVCYGLKKMGQFAKNNPAQSMEAAQWLKRLFGK